MNETLATAPIAFNFDEQSAAKFWQTPHQHFANSAAHACEFDEMMPIASISCRISSAAIVSPLIRDCIS
jgi:hypothetical protein